MQISSITERPYKCVRMAYSLSRVFKENHSQNLRQILTGM